MKHFQRREFLRMGGNLAAGIALAPIACKLMPKGEDAGKLKAFGIQIWTVRDVFPKDPKGVLKQIADAGYKQIETFEGPQGMFWGLGNTGFNNYIKELGMELVSAHNNVYTDFEKKVDEAAAIGLKNLTYAWEGPNKTIDDYKKMADDFNKKGELCKKNNIRFVFHNHDYTFRSLNGQFGQDILMQGTDAGLVDFEMDIYWVVAAGQDPEAWFKKYPNRFTLCHVKDRNKNPVEDNGKNSIELGLGSINYPQVLKTAKANGMKYYLVEQEAYPNGTSIQAIQADAEYMKKLKL